MTRSSHHATGLLFAVSSASLYGLNIVFARMASFAGANGSAIVVYRVFLMLALVAIVAFAARRSLAMAREERGKMLLLGISTAFVGICYLSSVAFIPVAVAAVVFYTFPILIVLASPFVEKTPLTPLLIGVVVVATFGVCLVVGPAFSGLDWRGLALAFAASVATAIQFFVAARCTRTGVVAKVFWIHLIVLPTSILISLVTGQLAPPSILALAPFAVAMTIGGYVFGFVLQFLALGRITAVAAGIIYCTEPVVASVASAFILGEALSPVQVAGGCLVLAAIMTNVLLEQRRLKDAPLIPIAD
ncbi:DMT family transporter [Microvirga guangxiensis]|uniref:Threonine/homoserine efflux transporter RhtA n=1 Tax=Microvirga guangxiensis TaxID=549386 RepID=A0A1G5E9Q6_9HYPH|nr:DMT family transporter [Microvirga guangxiensis]SCY23733.1 Threonine/homoserine efflux transporter RhtA [Microvirga guangxiensis]